MNECSTLPNVLANVVLFSHFIFRGKYDFVTSKCLASWISSVSLDKRHLKFINGFSVAIDADG